MDAADAADVYSRLTRDCAADFDRFDAHVVASILALAFYEARSDLGSIVDAVGLDGAALSRLVARIFPASAMLFEEAREKAPQRSEDEASLLDLLMCCRTDDSGFAAMLAAMVARRAQRPNHLWQDLGLQDRGELSTLMQRHFAPLARRNSKDMKWKKFLYRTICRDTGYSICAAPSCSECDDFDACFSEEAGESLLARIRRDSETAGQAGVVANLPVGFATAS